MLRLPAPSRVFLAVLALIMAVFVAAPLAEAAGCGTEAAAFADADFDQPDHDDGAEPCVHGHCHHNAAGVVIAAWAPTPARLTLTGYRPAADAAVASADPNSFLRPPRR